MSGDKYSNAQKANQEMSDFIKSYQGYKGSGVKPSKVESSALLNLFNDKGKSRKMVVGGSGAILGGLLGGGGGGEGVLAEEKK